MAIFHLSVKCFGRANGHSAVAAAAYRAGASMSDDRTGRRHDYSRKQGVLDAHLLLPPTAPAWTRDRFWNAAEKAETRKNSTIGRECLIALPHELDEASQLSLAKRFAQWLVQRYSIGVDCCVHAGAAGNDLRNVHAHLLLCTRVLKSDGFAEKTRILDSAVTGSTEINMWRQQWAEMSNSALSAAGIQKSIDHRSHISRRLDSIPTMKVGRHRGANDRAERNRYVRRLNRKLSEATAERDDALLASRAVRNIRLAQERIQAEASSGSANRSESPLARVEGRSRPAAASSFPLQHQSIVTHPLPAEIMGVPPTTEETFLPTVPSRDWQLSAAAKRLKSARRR